MLIHIGYAKAASTWTQSMFKAEGSGFNSFDDKNFLVENIQMPNSFEFDGKEVKNKIHNQFQTSEEEVNVLSSEGFAGNWPNGGYYSKMFADRLHEMFPEVKILIIIREQKSMLDSVYRHYVRRGGLRTPEEFLQPKKHLRCPDGSTPPGWYRTPNFNLDYYKYNILVEYYHELFSPDNVLVLPMEVLKESEEEYINTIREFAGVQHNPSLKEEVFRKHGGLSHFEAYVKRYTNPFLNADSMNDYTWTTPLDPYKSQYIWEKLIRGINMVCSEEIKDKIVKKRENTIDNIASGYYNVSNQKTNDLIEANLQQFGYDLGE